MITFHDRIADVRARREEGEKGFTLIELLVVVIIIGILAAIAIPIFLGQQEQAKGSAVKSALSTAKTQIVAKIVETGTFPADAQAIATAAAGDPKVTLTVSGGASAFCIQGNHTEVAGKTWAVDDKGGVLQGTCSATFVATATP